MLIKCQSASSFSSFFRLIVPTQNKIKQASSRFTCFIVDLIYLLPSGGIAVKTRLIRKRNSHFAKMCFRQLFWLRGLTDCSLSRYLHSWCYSLRLVLKHIMTLRRNSNGTFYASQIMIHVQHGQKTCSLSVICTATSTNVTVEVAKFCANKIWKTSSQRRV